MTGGRRLIPVVSAAVLGTAALWGLCGRGDRPAPGPLGRRRIAVKDLESAMARLRPLHRKLGKPRPGDWLAHHKEPGQSFAAYRRSRPLVPDARRHTIYIQPLGTFDEARRRIVTLTADGVGRFFNLPVKVRDDLPLSLVPAKARRKHPTWGDKQVLTGYVLDEVLIPRLPEDAFAYIALTTSDLWPGEGWNFVFGQAYLRQRTGVWSLYRYGDPSAGEAARRRCLLRTLKTATHELGHMFSMLHCTAYECGMCGSNSLAESDRRPWAWCPECMGKLCWATRTDPVSRYRRLHAFCRAHGLAEQAAFYARSLKALGAAPPATAPGSRPRKGP